MINILNTVSGGYSNEATGVHCQNDLGSSAASVRSTGATGIHKNPAHRLHWPPFRGQPTAAHRSLSGRAEAARLTSSARSRRAPRSEFDPERASVDLNQRERSLSIRWVLTCGRTEKDEVFHVETHPRSLASMVHSHRWAGRD